MEITMELKYLKSIFDACKNFVSKTDYKPIFQTVQLTCKKGFCTAYALDGFKVITLSCPCMACDDGMMCIPIIKLPKARTVILSDDGNDITFDFLDSKQTVRKYDGDFYKNPESAFPTEDPLLKICFNPKHLKDALGSFDDGNAVEISFYDPSKGCVIKGNGKKALVLPVFLKKNQQEV